MSQNFEDTSPLFGSNAVFVEEMLQKYLADPSSVDASWQAFFANLQDNNGKMRPQWGTKPQIIGVAIEESGKKDSKDLAKGKVVSNLTANVKLMIEAWRQYGHYLAKLDPLGMEKTYSKAQLGLTLENFGITEADLGQVIELNALGLQKTTIAEVIAKLTSIYGKHAAMECSYLQSPEEIKWLHSKFEQYPEQKFSNDEKIALLKSLIAVDGMEHFLHIKFPGAKRFSLEGGDASVAAIEAAISYVATRGVHNIVIGMAHRGRLATLTRVLGKPYRALFSEFAGRSAFPEELGIQGDVKYHMGYTGSKDYGPHKIDLTLLPNPSHLEAVNPLLAGNVRARQDFMNDPKRQNILGILLHGDSAFAGQGIVAESLAMSYIAPYQVGGVLHFVVNNQVGFTANPKDTRSSRYSTEMAKMSGAPIFHANGDDVESVAFVTQIAAEYRQNFGKDALVEIICYRKYGHNEGDEPMYTQPVMYDIIKQKESPATMYAKQLVASQVLTSEAAAKLKDDFKAHLDAEFKLAESYRPEVKLFQGFWSGFERAVCDTEADIATGVEVAKLVAIGTELCTTPANFAINPKLQKLFAARKEELIGNKPLDWATGEQLAFASLLTEGTPIRFTGQDVGRGTFSHRHSVLHSQTGGEAYIPLNNLTTATARYEVADSNLSEYGVLGFEYGYSLLNPKAMVLWEAQFGDFANGAQIIFDQFISAAETKWLQMSGLIVVLPHGFEGQGPEHSSARIERFLQLCAANNMQVANPTTPASLFHLLRRQQHRNFRKPLIIFSPKSLLRHKLAVSNLAEFDVGTCFKPVIDDAQIEQAQATRVIFCSGKVYYDLFEAREKAAIKDIALLRIEEYYPFPTNHIQKILANYPKATEFVWCQEEPKNMGAWSFMNEHLTMSIGNNKLLYCGREAAASPAVGYLSKHNAEQQLLVKQALKIGA